MGVFGQPLTEVNDMYDVLRLRNMRFYGRHGVLPEEEALGQRFEVDVELHLDLRPAGQSDELHGSVDYAAVYSLVSGIVTQERFHLLEALAERLATRIHEEFGPPEIAVRVRKPHPPVPGDFDGVEVEINRRFADPV